MLASNTFRRWRHADRGRTSRSFLRLILAAAMLATAWTCSAVRAITGCTDIGCASALSIGFTQHLTTGKLYEIEVCVDAWCRSGGATIEESRQQVDLGANDWMWVEGGSLTIDQLPAGDYSGKHIVTIEVVDVETQRTVIHESVATNFERSQPNGAGCPPICWRAEVRI